MTTAIMLRRARNALLDNVVIRGFERGIVAENSSLLMNRVRVVNGGIGVLLRRSYANILNSQIYGNLIDVLAEESDVNIINSIVLKIIAYLSNVSISHYAVNVYELQRLALDALRERNPENKRRKFKRLLKKIKKIVEIGNYAASLHYIIRELLRLLGFNV